MWGTLAVILLKSFPNGAKLEEKVSIKHFAIHLHFHVVCCQEILLYFSLQLLEKHIQSPPPSKHNMPFYNFLCKCIKVLAWNFCNTLTYWYIWTNHLMKASKASLKPFPNFITTFLLQYLIFRNSRGQGNAHTDTWWRDYNGLQPFFGDKKRRKKKLFRKEKNHQCDQTRIAVRLDSQQLPVWMLAPRQQRAISASILL